MRVIVTRAQPEAHKWVGVLTEAGFDAVALPLIEVASAANTQAVAQAWDRLLTYDAVMFVSGNAVDYFFASKPPEYTFFAEQAAIKTRTFATGPGTFAALQRAQVEPQFIDVPDLQAGSFDSEALWEVVRHRVHSGYRILIVRGGGGVSPDGDLGYGRDWFANQAAAAGATVEFVVAYQRLCPTLSDQDLTLVQEAAGDGSVWMFSSSEAISNLLACCPKQSWQHAKALTTHPRIALSAKKAGFAVVCESLPTVAALLASIESMQ